MGLTKSELELTFIKKDLMDFKLCSRHEISLIYKSHLLNDT